MKRTNIMLDNDQHRTLKAYAQKENRTIGKLVREAIDSAYGNKDRLEQRREVSLKAYQEGLISLGKLAEVLGLDPVAARLYLRERKIRLLVQDSDDFRSDAAHA
jgi:predicted HTH domain antitoxin